MNYESFLQVRRQHQQLQGAYTDAQYGLDTVETMAKASVHLNSVQHLLKNAILMQQQINNEQKRSVWTLDICIV